MSTPDLRLSLCFSDARLDLSDEDAAVALALTECSARSYAELLRSDIPSSSGLKSARSSALRPSPPSTLGVFSFGPAVVVPTRGEILVHLEGISRKPRSVKRRKTDSLEWDQPAPTKVQKLEAPSSLLVQRPERASSPLASPVLEPERDSPSLAEVPPVLGPLPSSEHIAEARNPSGEDGVQPLVAGPYPYGMPPLTVTSHLLGSRWSRREGKQNQKLLKTRILCFPTLNWRQVPSHRSSWILTL